VNPDQEFSLMVHRGLLRVYPLVREFGIQSPQVMERLMFWGRLADERRDEIITMQGKEGGKV